MPETANPTDQFRNATTNFIENFGKEMGGDEPAAAEIKETPAEAPKEAPKKADTVVSTPSEKPNEIADSDDKWPRTAVEWKKFRAARDEQIAKRDAEIKRVTAELEAARSQTAKPSEPPADYETAKKERDTLSEQLRLVAVEKHPKFQQYFDSKINQQMEIAKSIVGAQLADKVTGLLKLPNSPYKTSQIEEVIAELSPLAQMQVGGVINSLSSIESERQAEINRARENYEQIVAQNQSAAKERRSQAEKMFADTVSRLTGKEGVAVFQNRDGDAAWNDGVAKRIAAAKELVFGQPKPDDFIAAALGAAAYPAVLSALDNAHGELEKLRAQVAELTKAAPTLEGAKKPESPETTTTTRSTGIKSGLRPMDVAAEWMKGLPND